jgi:hypothetical protein
MGVTQPSRDPISVSGGSSMLSGGQVNDNAGQQMSSPGSPGAAPLPVAVGEQHQPPSFGTGGNVSREVETDAGGATSPFLPPGVVRGPGGRWAQAVPDAPPWRPTTSSS